MAAQSLAFRRGALLCAAYWLVVGSYFLIFRDIDDDFYGLDGLGYKVLFVPPAVGAAVAALFRKLWR